MTFCVVALAFVGGCRRMLEIVDASDNDQPVADEATQTSAYDDSPSPAVGRDLVGAPHGMQDVALIGLAASDLRQHTTRSDGADFDPAIDANGTVIVFASTRYSTNSHLFTKSVNGATITQVTDGPHNDAQPCFDPSTGTRIAFASDRAGHWDIWIVDVNGRNPIQMTNDPMPEMHPSWSPNGDRVAFSRVDAAKGTSTIWMADLNQPGVKRLIGEGMFPTWSPDGRRIAYQRAKARGSRWYSIWTVELREDEVLFPTEVASRTDAAVISPAWSPDGTQLAFSMLRGSVIDGLSTMADIGVVGADGRGLMRLTTGSAENHGPAWGADGRIYFSSRADDSETIWSVKPFRVPTYDPSPSATTSDTRRAAFAEDATAE
jgi:TolB protein